VSENERQQRMVERVQEDERLGSDLSDAAATALVEWASQRVAAAAADPARPDSEVEAEVQAVRTAARAAARSGEGDPQKVIAYADAALAGRSGPFATQAQPAPAAQPVAAASGAAVPPTSRTSEPSKPAPAPPPQREPGAAAPFWRRWKPFAGIWNRSRGDR